MNTENNRNMMSKLPISQTSYLTSHISHLKSHITHLLLSISYLYFLFSCAQQIPPTGGKKDIIPPKLIKTVPLHKQTNYKDKVVDLTFDEYVVVENLQQKLLITPDAGEYNFKVKPNGLRITFNKTLDSAKTYSLSFGDAVKDFAEKNPAQNLRLVFSTGIGIDSASVSGVVKDILTDKPILDALVGLYNNTDTLNVEKMKPSYFTRTDTSGRFSLENIQPSTYKLVAIDDRNRSMTYNPKAEKIAYMQDSITLTPSTQISAASLALFYSNYTPPKVRSTQPKAHYYTLSFDKGIYDYKVKFNTPDDSIPYFRSGNNDIKFFNTKNKKDTISVKIWMQDSLGLIYENVQKIKFREIRGNAKNTENAKESFDMTTSPSVSEELRPKNLVYKLTFSKPVGEERLAQIQLFSDSTKTEQLTKNDFKWANNRTELTIERAFLAKKELKIVLPKATFFSIENDTIPAKTIKIPVKNEENYGIIEGNISGTTTPFIIELLNDKMEVEASLFNQKKYEFNYIKPNVYFIRIVLDHNNNGKWDTGNFKKKIQPEKVQFYPEAIKVKKNFVMSSIDINVQNNTK
jgi:Bacterial Ig-like domain